MVRESKGVGEKQKMPSWAESKHFLSPSERRNIRCFVYLTDIDIDLHLLLFSQFVLLPRNYNDGLTVMCCHKVPAKCSPMLIALLSGCKVPATSTASGPPVIPDYEFSH